MLAGTYALDRRRETEAQKGAARALYFEVIHNAVYLEGMARAEVPIRHIREETWRATQVAVAGFLTPREFDSVALCYSLADFHRPNTEAAIASRTSDQGDRSVWRGAAADFSRAGVMLRDRAWDADARAELVTPRDRPKGPSGGLLGDQPPAGEGQ